MMSQDTDFKRYYPGLPLALIEMGRGACPSCGVEFETCIRHKVGTKKALLLIGKKLEKGSWYDRILTELKTANKELSASELAHRLQTGENMTCDPLSRLHTLGYVYMDKKVEPVVYGLNFSKVEKLYSGGVFE